MAAANIIKADFGPAPKPASQVELVFDRLLTMILDGHYPEKSRLPAERDLCAQLDTSRGTLREALRRLGDWGIVEARHGSGMIVCDQVEWQFDVLPAYLKLRAKQGLTEDVIKETSDLLAMQQEILVATLRFAARTATTEGLEASRVLLHEAFAARHDHRLFIEKEFIYLRSLLGATNSLPAQWLMNRIGGVFQENTLNFAGAFEVPDDYLTYFETILDLMAQHDADAVGKLAHETMSQANDQILQSLKTLLPSKGD